MVYSILDGGWTVAPCLLLHASVPVATTHGLWSREDQLSGSRLSAAGLLRNTLKAETGGINPRKRKGLSALSCIWRVSWLIISPHRQQDPERRRRRQLEQPAVEPKPHQQNNCPRAADSFRPVISNQYSVISVRKSDLRPPSSVLCPLSSVLWPLDFGLWTLDYL